MLSYIPSPVLKFYFEMDLAKLPSLGSNLWSSLFALQNGSIIYHSCARSLAPLLRGSATAHVAAPCLTLRHHLAALSLKGQGRG